ncbi:hypothetical protein MTR_5g029860 [Medicago truncatula]|uniref:Uncharacterized protein n=1 Tax=Medicago truncatula TaxID=3880 RepID=G7KDQ1_MEDTR|nr:hypothetical protein MTR_5g029860 [Medicago truncatula]
MGLLDHPLTPSSFALPSALSPQPLKSPIHMAKSITNGLYPKGNPSRNSQRLELDPSLRGDQEIVFNQQ